MAKPAYADRLASINAPLKPLTAKQIAGLFAIVIGCFVMMIPTILGPVECEIGWAIVLVLSGAVMVWGGWQEL